MLKAATVILCVAQLALSQQLPLSASPSGWPQQQLQSYNRFTASRGYNNANSYQVPNDAAANGAFLSSTAQRAFANWNARAPSQPSYASQPSVQQPVSNYIPTAPSSSLPEWARALAPSTTQQQYSTSPQYTITPNSQQQNSNSPQFTTTSNVQQQSQYGAWNPSSSPGSASNTNSRFSLIAPSSQQSNTDTTSRTSQQQTYSPDSSASYTPSQPSSSSSFGSSSSAPNTLTTGEVQQALNILLQQQASGSTNPMVSSAIQAINALQSSQPGQQQTTGSDALPAPSFAAAAAAYTPSPSQQTSSSAGQYGSSSNSDSSNAFVSNAIRDSLKGFGGGSRAQTTQDYSASPSAYLSQPQRIQPSFANGFGNQNSARSPFQVPNYNSVSPSSSSAYIPRVSHDSPPLSELQQRFSGGQYASPSSPYGSAADSDRSVDSFRRIGGSRSSSGGRPSWATS